MIASCAVLPAACAGAGGAKHAAAPSAGSGASASGAAGSAAGATGSGGNASAAGDFGFLTGEWKIANRRLSDADPKVWEEFPGEATVYAALDGLASLEWLRIPVRKFAGMGIRLFRPETKVWADHWVNAKSGVVGEPMLGTFSAGVGTFISEETTGDTKMLARGVWDQITPTSCRWFQSTSTDGGATWIDNWIMQWTRVG